MNCGNRLLPVVSSPQQAQPMISDATLPTINVPEQIDAGTIGTRFMPTVQSPFDTTPAAPANPPEGQGSVEDSISFTPDSAADSSPYSTLALDQTIAQLLDEGENHYKAKRFEDALAVNIVG